METEVAVKLITKPELCNGVAGLVGLWDTDGANVGTRPAGKKYL